jgi:hypothetical protein
MTKRILGSPCTDIAYSENHLWGNEQAFIVRAIELTQSRFGEKLCELQDNAS